MMDKEDDVNYGDYERGIEIEGLLDGNEENGRYLSGLSDRSMAHTKPLLVKRINTTSQIAIVGANLSPIESLDYEIFYNEILKHDWRSRKKSQTIQYVVLKWGFALLIGLGTGLVGFFNSYAVENIAGFKLLMTTSLMSKNSADFLRPF